MASATPYGYLPSRRASPPFGLYQIILLGNKVTLFANTEQFAQGRYVKVERPGVHDRKSTALTIAPSRHVAYSRRVIVFNSEFIV